MLKFNVDTQDKGVGKANLNTSNVKVQRPISAGQ